MSQMKPYCFKCGAELDPEAIYCPACGRLQRSMVVRAVDPNAPSAPAPPEPAEGPVEFYPDREPQSDQPYSYHQDTQQPDQHDPYAEQQYSEQSWYAGEHSEPQAEPGDHVYAQQQEDAYPEQAWSHEAYQEQQPETPYYEEPAPIYEEPGPIYEARPETSYPAYEPTEPAYEAGEPVYSSAAPRPASPSSRYQEQPYAPPAANPYAPPYAPDYADQRSGPGRGRLLALAAGGLLALFLIGLGIGHLFASGSPSPPSAATGPQGSAPPAAPPSTAPTATPAPQATPTPDQGVTGAAKFQSLGADIPGGHCTTAQGCPITVNLKNSGGSGSGTVTVTLSDDSGNSIATFTGQIPNTDSGQTVQVSGNANSDQLPAYLRSGGIVHITNSGISIKDGGG